MDHLILARRLDLVIVKNNNNNSQIVDFVVQADHRVKLKENEDRNKYLDPSENWKTMEHESDGDTNCSWSTWRNYQRIGKGIEILGNKRTSWNYSGYSLIKKG